MTATWTVTSMDRTFTVGDLSDVVTTLHWEVADSETVGDVTHTGRDYGMVALETPDSSNFTAYADISHETAVSWVKAALGSEQVTAHETSVEDQITASKTPEESAGVPW